MTSPASQRELQLEVENYRLKQRLALVAKFAQAAERELIILASIAPEDASATAAERPERRADEAT